jgi:RNA recognition motif-containing protein
MTTRVYLGKLPRECNERDVHHFFKELATSIRETTLKNGFGFVEFKTPADAAEAVATFNNRGASCSLFPLRTPGPPWPSRPRPAARLFLVCYPP